MPRGVKKENLPSKICATCEKPFTWRKVWENCWDEVQCCSDRCKNERKRKQQLANREQRAAAVEGLAPDTAAAPAPAVAVQQSPP
ncbi:hypothetical protein CHLRE_17g733174v5 [Chlamydomonas reinhardtii]|uniref:DUF2256 domain-containing protein n=1 Tax=Chlamydomonas reinhardtii TaxID=3055 RepID=A0A2K3CR52_CHLRE|nr:uncharacterized protein CHLRE_17g733174v5 [Chlamydomonas reinhardtii]PNW70759.1 hypothetical protein CHLRE_17g733174v5 [Chlamydomonas reinhardtii]